MQLQTIAKAINAEIIGDTKLDIKQIATLRQAKINQLSFLANNKYLSQLATTQASVVILQPKHQEYFEGTKLIVANVYLAFAKVSQLFNPQPKFVAGIHSSAIIATTANIAASAKIGPNVVIGDNVKIGNHSQIGAGCVVDVDCELGDYSQLVANVSLLANTRIGNNCLIHAGTVIGGDGFGFANDNGKAIKIPQIGGVIIGNEVEVGSGTTIDCGTIEPTIIGNGVKIDNQIQIGHNVVIGDNTAIAAATAIAGSAEIGTNCQIGGATTIVGHIKIANATHITAASFITKSTEAGKVYSSAWSAKEIKVWQKMVARFWRLPKLLAKLN